MLEASSLFAMSTAAPEPVVPQDAPAAPPAATPPNSPDVVKLQQKLDLVLQDRQKQGETNAKLNESLRELTAELNAIKDEAKNRKATKLEQSGDYPALVEQLKQDLAAAQTTIAAKDTEIGTLKGEVETVKSTVAKKQFEQSALDQIQAVEGIINAKQTLKLLEAEGKIRDKDGSPVVLNGGVEQPLAEFVQSLKQPNSGYEHFFTAGGASGMGATNTVVGSSNVPLSDNPYILGNLTMQIALETREPEKAKLLQAEANRQRAAQR
jgi:hypothetical protein